MTKPNSTLVACLIDGSGSMHDLIEQTISGFNEFVGEQLRHPGDIKFSVAIFNH